MRASLSFWLLVSIALVPFQVHAAVDETVRLPHVVVRESRVTDYGMSIVTNLGVLFGGKIKWMRVGQVVAGSPAAKQGLMTDDLILAIDQRATNTFDRHTMLPIFFEKRSGDRVKLLVRSSSTRKFRLVELAATLERR